MRLNNFKASLKNQTPPPNISPNLLALWYDGKGNWTKAHDIADGNPYPKVSLVAEWENLVIYFLEKDA